MLDHAAASRVLLQNLRTMCEEIDELLSLPTEHGHGLVRNQLEFVSTKLELAVSMAAHGAGVVAVTPEEPPPPVMPDLGATIAELMVAVRPAGEAPVRLRNGGRKVRRKAA